MIEILSSIPIWNYLGSIDIDDCKYVWCQNGGTCIDGINSSTCKCARGYQGINCALSKILFFYKLYDSRR